MSNYNKPMSKSDYAFTILLLTLAFFLISYTYLEIQHRAKKDLKISDEDKYFIENKITGKEFDNIPNSSAYLFSQVLSNQYLLDMANTYKKEYYQEQKRQLIQYVIFSSILSFVFIAGILANYTMRKRLKRIDFATKSMLRMA